MQKPSQRYVNSKVTPSSNRIKGPGFYITIVILLSLLMVACSDEGQTNQPDGSPGSNNVSTPATNALIRVPTVPKRSTATGGSITGAQIREGDTLHLYKTVNPTSLNYQKLLFSASLTHRNATNLNLEPGAAASWNIDKGSKTVTFKLKDGLKWSDGQPLTALDYVWTYQQAVKPENGWPLAQSVIASGSTGSASGLVSYTAPDPLTLMVQLSSYTADIVSRADLIEPLPKHVWEKLDWNDSLKNTEIDQPTVVSGPWLLKEWKKGDHITFTRNPLSSIYPVPLLETLTVRTVSDSQEALQKMKTGEVDFFIPEAADLSAFEQVQNLQTYLWTPGKATFQFVGFNFRKSVWQDKNLRQALAYVTNRQDILNQAGAGKGKVAYSDVLPWQPEYTDNVSKFSYDPAKAQELLKKAGYTLNGNRLADKNGTILPTLKLAYNTPSSTRDAIAQNLTKAFATLGITVETTTFDFNSYVKFLSDGKSDYDLFLLGWQTDYDPENFGEVWQNIPQLNFGAYNNSKLLDLYKSAVQETDNNKRKAIMAQIQQLEADELPYLYLYAGYDWAVINKKVGGIAQTLGGVDYNLYTDWYIINS